MNLFLIEDNPAFALLLKTEITKSFPENVFSISVFETGESCKKMLHLEPEMVIVDYHLNSTNPTAMDGLETMEMIRAQVPQCDFVMVTADKHTELFLRSKEHAVYDYLIKDTNVPYRLSLTLNHWLKLKSATE